MKSKVKEKFQIELTIKILHVFKTTYFTKHYLSHYLKTKRATFSISVIIHKREYKILKISLFICIKIYDIKEESQHIAKSEEAFLECAFLIHTLYSVYSSRKGAKSRRAEKERRRRRKRGESRQREESEELKISHPVVYTQRGRPLRLVERVVTCRPVTHALARN